MISIRQALPSDIHNIRHLYLDVYEGNYPLTIITDVKKTGAALNDPKVLWLVAEAEDKIVGSIIFRKDSSQLIGHTFGAVVDPAFRGNNLTMKMMELGLDKYVGKEVDLIYATTRTLLPMPQILTERLGFVKLGVFPNVRRVKQSETHCLAAKYSLRCLEKRRTKPVLHRDLMGLYRLVQNQMGLEDADYEDVKLQQMDEEPLNFEVINAPNFIYNRYRELEGRKELATTFYPFEIPNLLLCSKDLKNEVYIYHSKRDLHCAVIAEKLEKGVGYSRLLSSIAASLEEIGIRYIEILVNAYEPRLQAEVLLAGFLPSAYIPAMTLVNGKRLDYLVFTRTFEMLDFYKISLRGLYVDFLKEFLILWKKYYVEPVLL